MVGSANDSHDTGSGKSDTAEFRRVRMRRQPFERPFARPCGPSGTTRFRAPPPPPPPAPKRTPAPSAHDTRPAQAAAARTHEPPALPQPQTTPASRNTRRATIGQLRPQQIERLAHTGTVGERIRIACSDHTELAMQVVASPALPENAMLKIAENPVTSNVVLGYLARSRRCRCNQQVIRALLHNPKTPAQASLFLLPFVPRNELHAIARKSDLPQPLLQRVRFLLEGRRRR